MGWNMKHWNKSYCSWWCVLILSWQKYTPQHMKDGQTDDCPWVGFPEMNWPKPISTPQVRFYPLQCWVIYTRNISFSRFMANLVDKKCGSSSICFFKSVCQMAQSFFCFRVGRKYAKCNAADLHDAMALVHEHYSKSSIILIQHWCCVGIFQFVPHQHNAASLDLTWLFWIRTALQGSPCQ